MWVRAFEIGLLSLLVAGGCYREPANPQNMNVPGGTGDAMGSNAPLENPEGDATKTDQSTEAGPEVALGTMKLTAPDGWLRKAASSGFVMTEFALPKAQGDDRDARLTVSSASGGIEANVTRWKGQFVPEPTESSQKTIKVGDVDVTIVDFSGTYNDQRGPFAPGTKREGYRMLAAIIPLGGTDYFVKCYGPKATVAAHADEFMKFVKSLAPRS